MIVVKLELHSARTGRVSEIGRAHVINDGSSDSPARGNYEVRVMRRGTKHTIQRSGHVPNHPRLSASIWSLLRKALTAAGY